jgi:hypothetical protein
MLQWLDQAAEVGLVRLVLRGSWRGSRNLAHRAFSIAYAPDLLEGEDVKVAAQKHWVSAVPSLVLCTVGVVALFGVLIPGGVTLTWFSAAVPLLVLSFGVDRLLNARKDVFVVTTYRVMRLSGVYRRKEAEMPLRRVLDVTVEKPFLLRPLNVGHVILENAGQEQGLREMRFLHDPSHIRRVIAELHAVPSAGGEASSSRAAPQHTPQRSATARYWLATGPSGGGPEPDQRP